MSLAGLSVKVFRIDIPGWTKAVGTYEAVWHGLDWSGRWPFSCELLQVSGLNYSWFLLPNISFCLLLVPQRCFWQALWCSVNVTELRRFQYVPLDLRPDTWWWLKTMKSPVPCQGTRCLGEGAGSVTKCHHVPSLCVMCTAVATVFFPWYLWLFQKVLTGCKL